MIFLNVFNAGSIDLYSILQHMNPNSGLVLKNAYFFITILGSMPQS